MKMMIELLTAREARVSQPILFVAVILAALNENYPKLSGLNFAVIFLLFATALDRSPIEVLSEPKFLLTIRKIAVYAAFVLIAVALFSLVVRH